MRGKYRRGGKILEETKETRRYYKLEYESLAPALWIVGSGRDYGRAVDHTTE